MKPPCNKGKCLVPDCSKASRPRRAENCRELEQVRRRIRLFLGEFPREVEKADACGYLGGKPFCSCRHRIEIPPKIEPAPFLPNACGESNVRSKAFRKTVSLKFSTKSSAPKMRRPLGNPHLSNALGNMRNFSVTFQEYGESGFAIPSP